jgi:hypothetical protein
MKLIAQSLSGAPREFNLDLAKSLIADGGGGFVYRDASSGGRAIKILKELYDPIAGKLAPSHKTESVSFARRLDAMLRQVPDCMFAPGKMNFCQIAWPMESISLPNGKIIGFSMPLIDRASSIRFEELSGTTSRRLANMTNDLGFRLGVCSNLASMVQSVHDKGHAIVDLRAENILVDRNLGLVTLIDCDGYRINSGPNAFLAPLVDFTKAAPEIHKGGPKSGDENSDRFALAFLIFEILNNGVTPYNVRSRHGAALPNNYEGKIQQGLYGYGLTPHSDVEAVPKSSHRVWPLTLRKAFDAAFLSQPHERPIASELARLCKNYWDTAKPCQVDRDHGHSVIEGECWSCSALSLAKQATQPSGKPAQTLAKKFGTATQVPPLVPPLPTVPQPLLTPTAMSFYQRHQTPILTAICSVFALIIVSKWVNPSSQPGTASYAQGVVDATARTNQRIADLEAAATTAEAPAPNSGRQTSGLAVLGNGRDLTAPTPAAVSAPPQVSGDDGIGETGRLFGDQNHGPKGMRYAVTSGAINIRTGPGPNSSLSSFDPLTFGTKVRVLRRQISPDAPESLPKFWFLIETMDGTDRRGWVNSELLRKFLPNGPVVDGLTGKSPDFIRMTEFDFAQSINTIVRSQGLNVRTSPGPLNPLVTKLGQGDSLVALSGADLFTTNALKIAEWWRVQLPDGREGWINAEFVD